MNRGIVKWFSSKKGYGFLTMEDGTDIFVHYSGLNKEGFRTVDDGETVIFDVIDTEIGKQAVNVTVVDKQINKTELKKWTKKETDIIRGKVKYLGYRLKYDGCCGNFGLWKFKRCNCSTCR